MNGKRSSRKTAMGIEKITEMPALLPKYKSEEKTAARKIIIPIISRGMIDF
jgi:hypothetical protein